MTWTKTSDDYPDRLLELSDAAYRLHHAATTYSNRLGFDGRIPKTRVSLIPVPAKTRRPATITELVERGLWREDGAVWELVDYFEAQLSAEEVECRREYDAIRQRKRFAPDAETKALLAEEEHESKARLNAARERRRARTSHRESPRESQRPVPFRPDPPRSAPSESEGGMERRSTGPEPVGDVLRVLEETFPLDTSGAAMCTECRRPTSVHAKDCSEAA